MDAAPYYAPTYFPASYFYAATVQAPELSSTGMTPYDTPSYFPSSYFYNAPTPAPASSATGMTPYDTPSYFPSSYFYNAPTLAPASSATGMTPYNAPTYFPSSYFYGTSSPTVVPTTSSTSTTTPSQSATLESLAALLSLVKGTGAFEEVIFGASTRRSQAGADTYPLAVVTLRGWEEADEVDPISIVRRTTFSITVVVKSEDDLPRFDLLDGLSSAIKQAVDRSDLGGTCLPALTWIGSGRYDYSGHYPEQSIDLEGGFSSIIDPTAIAPVSS